MGKGCVCVLVCVCEKGIVYVCVYMCVCLCGEGLCVCAGVGGLMWGGSALRWPVKVYVYVCTCTRVPVGDRGRRWISPSALPSTSIETGSSVGLDLKN